MNAVYVSVESKVLPSYPVGDLPLWMWNDGFWISSYCRLGCSFKTQFGYGNVFDIIDILNTTEYYYTYQINFNVANFKQQYNKWF